MAQVDGVAFFVLWRIGLQTRRINHSRQVSFSHPIASTSISKAITPSPSADRLLAQGKGRETRKPRQGELEPCFESLHALV